MSERKTAVVVGATGNIGQAICDTLERSGYELDPTWLCADRPDAAKASSYLALPSRIDLAIYVAGVNRVCDAHELSESVWDEVINVNLKGAFLFFKAAFPAMKAAGSSSLIAISSIMVTHPYPGRLPYTVAKAGLEGMVRALAVEWGPYGVSAHGIRLGHVTGLMKTSAPNPLLLDAVTARTPLNRLIEPTDVAGYVAWLANGGCKSVSGSIIDFEPAYTMNRWPL